MPATAVEFVQSRTTTIGTSPQHEKIYIVRGTDDESVALTAAWNTAANSFGGSGVFPYLSKKNATVEPTSVIEGNANACIWTATIGYVRPQAGTGGGQSEVFSFDTGGGTRHITQSILTMAANSVADVTANMTPNVDLYEQAIGVIERQGSTEIEGVDIVSPVFNFSEIHYIPNANVTPAYKQTLAELTGAVNDDAFKGYAAGEVLFIGASGSMRTSDNIWEITFKFAAQKNQSDVKVGAVMIFDFIRGWDYLWIQYKPDPTKPTARSVPSAAYVEQVYPDKDFELLAIGTT